MKVLLSPGQWGCEICGPADLAEMRPVIAKLEHNSFKTARVMAAAPEMQSALKAAKKLLCLIEQEQDPRFIDSQFGQETAAEISAALRKAAGSAA